jgi:hypothetical protein
MSIAAKRKQRAEKYKKAAEELLRDVHIAADQREAFIGRLEVALEQANTLGYNEAVADQGERYRPQ